MNHKIHITFGMLLNKTSTIHFILENYTVSHDEATDFQSKCTHDQGEATLTVWLKGERG
jgi:hypothetical protein